MIVSLPPRPSNSLNVPLTSDVTALPAFVLLLLKPCGLFVVAPALKMSAKSVPVINSTDRSVSVPPTCGVLRHRAVGELDVDSSGSMRIVSAVVAELTVEKVVAAAALEEIV